MSRSFFFCLSFTLVAFGSPALVPFLGIASSAGGFALFWWALMKLESRVSRFWIASFWFGLVQAVQLMWLACPHYMGYMILAVYAALVVVLGLQFGLLSLFFSPKKAMNWLHCLAVAGTWVLLEASRLLLLSGFSFNPVGLALSDTVAIQLAAVGGIFGLSFWVIFVNLLAFRALQFFNRQRIFIWASFALAPYLFGVIHQKIMQSNVAEQPLRVALIQTALMPEQRHFTRLSPDAYISPLEQWKRVWDLFPTNGSLDLIVLPESAFPYGAFRPFLSFEKAHEAWVHQFGQEAGIDFPPLVEPYVVHTQEKGSPRWKVTEAFFAQSLANHYNADLIIGLDDQDAKGTYNAAFHFTPRKEPVRYEKRILVPVAEYLPLGQIDVLSAFYAQKYHIFDSCTPGKEARVFAGKKPIGPSICYEETFGHVMRDLRQGGAELFVNVTNDAWYPGTRLPQHHFHHARVRAAENGVYLLRSCNTGITGAVDCFGNTVAVLPPSESEAGLLLLDVPASSHFTLYTLWGNWMIVCLSALFLLVWSLQDINFFRGKVLPLNGQLR